ncbi:MAG TPA: plastocyanin/azurin family copper-binding protein [Acidimicrobiales bacterium]|nr:plastocyanin/azurin family copper-binding protein [Acidimicrobiales bacterium]
MPSRRSTLLGIAAIAAALLGACGDEEETVAPAAPGQATVVVDDLRFQPKKIEIAAGETVTWRFQDGGVAHDVVGEGFKSEVEKSGTYRFTFDEPGTYDYKCTIHPGMKGTVVVS